MIGSIVIATAIEYTHNQDGQVNGVSADLPSGEKGFLRVDRMIGKTREDRQQTLEGIVGTSFEAEIVGETTVKGVKGHRLSQWGALRRKLDETAEKWMTDETVIEAVVNRVQPDFAIVDLPEGLSGLLHITRVAGNSVEEQAARFGTITVGDSIHVKVSEVKRPRRVRVAEFVA